MLRAEMAHPAPDARRELSDERQKLHVVLTELARLTRIQTALSERRNAEPRNVARLQDFVNAANRRAQVFARAIEVARECDRVLIMWDSVIIRNDNGVAS